MNKYILALDQGTTSSRAILYDMNFNVVANSQKEFTQIYPNEGWVEHNPIEIWESQLECIHNTLSDAKIESTEIASIGITNQRETVVAWDKSSGKPIYNAIVWQDRRTAKDCDKDIEDFGLEENRNKTGLNLDAYFSASKFRWILRNLPEALKLSEKEQLCMGTIDSWLIWNLTKGKLFVTDYSNASRTNLFNIQELKWDSGLLDYYSIPRSVLAKVVDSIGEIGKTSAKILGAEIPISGIAGDQQAALYGHRCWEKGMMKNTFGTGCFLLQNIGNQFKLSENKLLTTIAWKQGNDIVYALEGSVFNAGSALKWLKENLGLFSTYAEADKLSESIDSSENVLIVPAFTGLGAPYWDMYARGSIFGMTRNTKREHIIRATFESLAYQCKDIIDTMTADSGTKMSSLQIDGGVSKSPFLRQFLADILQIKIELSSSNECTALGVAMMASKGLGISIHNIETSQNKSFSPNLSEDKANSLYIKWKEAVKRSMNWIED